MCCACLYLRGLKGEILQYVSLQWVWKCGVGKTIIVMGMKDTCGIAGLGRRESLPAAVLVSLGSLGRGWAPALRRSSRSLLLNWVAIFITCAAQHPCHPIYTITQQTSLSLIPLQPCWQPGLIGTNCTSITAPCRSHALCPVDMESAIPYLGSFKHRQHEYCTSINSRNAGLRAFIAPHQWACRGREFSTPIGVLSCQRSARCGMFQHWAAPGCRRA